MKTFFTLLASLIISISVFAADAKPKSALTIQSADRTDIRVIIDGRRFEPNDNRLRIEGLNAGSHAVKIYQQKNNGVFSILGKKYQVVFNSTVNIKPRADVMISIDRSGKTIITDTKTNGRFDRNDRGNNGRDNKDWNKDNDFDFDHGNNSGDYNNDRDGRFGDYDTRNGYESGMSDREFNRVLESIQKEWLETNKLKSATQTVTTSRLTSAQVTKIVWLFSFENNKLELAKRAYANTVDKRNYNMVNDAFSFNSSKEELARYIRNFR